MADRGRNVLLEILFSLIFRVLLKLICDITVNRLTSLFSRQVVIPIDARFQSAFVTIEGGSPALFGIGSFAPGAVLPYNLQVIKIEGSGLRIGNVRFALLVHENSASGAYA